MQVILDSSFARPAISFPEAAILLVSDGIGIFQRMSKGTPGDEVARPGSAPIWGGKKGEFRDWTKHAHASYPGLFFRPPGFSPYMGREERRVQGLD